MTAARLEDVLATSLSELKPLLRKWINVNKILVRNWQRSKGDGDLPWWYLERASVSVLAGAAWKTGGLAFEEFSEDKKAGKKRKTTVHGRVDLYLKLRDNEFIAEAKYCQVSATYASTAGIGKLRGKLRSELEKACAGIRKCPRRGQRKLGILFATPYIAKSQKARVDEIVRTWLEAVKGVKCAGSAWVFPRHISDQHKWPGDIWPGAVVLMREV